MLLTFFYLELLEEHLNVTVTEPNIDEKERLKSLSKEEIIECYLRAKVSLSYETWLQTCSDLRQETKSVREQPVSKKNSPAQKGSPGAQLFQQPVTEHWGSSNRQHNPMGIVIDTNQVAENLGAMEVKKRAKSRSVSANSALLWRNDAPPSNRSSYGESGSHGKKTEVALVSEVGHGTNEQWGATNGDVANATEFNWGGDDQFGSKSINGNTAEPTWGGAGQTDHRGNEGQVQAGEVASQGWANSNLGNEGQVNEGNGGWSNTRSEQNQGVAW